MTNSNYIVNNQTIGVDNNRTILNKIIEIEDTGKLVLKGDIKFDISDKIVIYNYGILFIHQNITYVNNTLGIPEIYNYGSVYYSNNCTINIENKTIDGITGESFNEIFKQDIKSNRKNLETKLKNLKKVRQKIVLLKQDTSKPDFGRI